VDGKQAVERCDALVHGGLCLLANAGIVHQHIEPSASCMNRQHERHDLLFRCHVRLDAKMAARTEFFGSCACSLSIQVDNRDAKSVSREPLCRRPADAACATGDDGDPLVVSFIHRICLLTALISAARSGFARS